MFYPWQRVLYNQGINSQQPGHEYTRGNVKFGTKVIQTDAIKKLEDFANNNKQTQGKSTIGDEKVCSHEVYMCKRGKADVRIEVQRLHDAGCKSSQSQSLALPWLTHLQDPTVQKFTGKKNRVDVMAALREAKNNA